MSDQFVGEIRMFGFNFAPVGWAQCNGQLLPINQNDALFALLGTFYGGDGVQTFGLPNLQSRVPIHQGEGLGLSPYVIGQEGGTESVTLVQEEMPQHGHQVAANSGTATGTRPAGSVLGRQGSNAYSGSSDGTTMNVGMIATSGGSQPHNNIQPFLVVNFCIALVGIFPARN